MPHPSASLCVVTPRLPPAIDGLGDFCVQLWRHWLDPSVAAAGEHTESRRWQFLVTDGADESRRRFPDLDVRDFACSRDLLSQALKGVSARVLILQYVGYGYDRAGSPQWLPDALSDWLSADDARRLIVMFHETWASGPPWSRVYWDRFAQRRCAQRLLAIAHRAVTSNQATFDDLKTLPGADKVALIPLGTSFDVADVGKADFSDVLVFGREASRNRCLGVHEKLLMRLDRSDAVGRIVLAGESRNAHSDAGIERLRRLCPDKEIVGAFNFDGSELPPALTGCGLSLMHTESTCLLKSTAFHLAAALGQVAVCRAERSPGMSVVDGRHFLGYAPDSPDLLIERLSDRQLLESVGTQVRGLASTIFSWPAVARSWRKLVDETGLSVRNSGEQQ